MKKNRKWLRVTALVLAMACLVSAVFAATFDSSLDLSGDKKVNVWDIQMAVNDGKTEEAQKILTGALGSPDELNPVSDNTYEIYTTLGLYNMAKLTVESDGAAGKTFVLKADIDLDGANWTPINFKGTLDGNGYAIKNVTVAGYHTANDGYGHAFFANTYSGSVIKNLCMENVSLDVSDVPTDKDNFVALLVASNRGTIQNCTTVGAITDDRTGMTEPVYVGRLVGRNIKGSTIEYTSDFADFLEVNSGVVGVTNTQETVEGIATQMATFFADSSNKKIGLAGWAYDGTVVDNNDLFEDNWQDITNSTDLAPVELQERRQKVVDYMYEICTVEWTPTAEQGTLTYHVYKNNASRSQKPYTAGTRYKGIPYNHGSSGLERFEAWVNDPDMLTDAYYFTDKTVVAAFNEAGAGNTIASLTTSAGKTYENVVVPEDWETITTTPIITGFGRYIGNDCSSAAAWAWRQVCAVSGTDFSNLQTTSVMIPSNDYVNDAGTTKRGYIYNYGIRPVNGLTFDHPHMDMDGDGNADNDLTGDSKVNHSDYADMVEAVFGTTETSQQAYWNAMAGTSKGDALVGYNDDGGHTRVAAGDAVVIRDSAGKILPKVSYIVTHEQGRGSKGTDSQGAWESSCTVNCLYTFDQLTNYADYPTGIGSRCCYFPITNKALREVDTPAATAWCKITDGKVTSNFHIVSTTVGEEVIYTNTTLTGSRSRCTEVTPASVHTANTGTVTVLLSNGETFTFDY